MIYSSTRYRQQGPPLTVLYLGPVRTVFVIHLPITCTVYWYPCIRCHQYGSGMTVRTMHHLSLLPYSMALPSLSSEPTCTQPLKTGKLREHTGLKPTKITDLKGI